MSTLRDGTEAGNPKLDRLVEFDERSRNFPLREVAPKALRSKTWLCRTHLDQGQEGACVGFSWAHELIASPSMVSGLNGQFAKERIYWEAQKIDPWPGGSYPGASPRMEGTSILAGAKIVQSLGYIGEYRWGFGIDDALRGVQIGPGVAGTVWLGSMFEPRPSGLLEVSRERRDIMGGHAYLVRGLRLKARIEGTVQEVVRVRNSWGKDWGDAGDCFIKVEDFEWLLEQQGEFCIPVTRYKIPRPPTDA
jgi:hypothetical protein